MLLKVHFGQEIHWKQRFIFSGFNLYSVFFQVAKQAERLMCVGRLAVLMALKGQLHSDTLCPTEQLCPFPYFPELPPAL